jgi:hypothetical protein
VRSEISFASNTFTHRRCRSAAGFGKLKTGLKNNRLLSFYRLHAAESEREWTERAAAARFVLFSQTVRDKDDTLKKEQLRLHMRATFIMNFALCDCCVLLALMNFH